MDVTNEGLKLVTVGLLAFVRIAGFFVQAPIWGSHHFDKKILVASAAVWTIIIYPKLMVPSEMDFHPIAYLLMVASQFLVGVLMGFTSFIIMCIAQFAGEMLDTQMGLSTAASYDPASGGSTNMMRHMQFYIAMILFLLFDGHHFLIRIVFRSFDLIPLTGMAYPEGMVHHLITLTGKIFYVGVQLASPAMAALFITQIGLGMLARVAPQMNVFMLSFPLNIAIGLTVVSSALMLIIVFYHKQFAVWNTEVMTIVNFMKFTQ